MSADMVRRLMDSEEEANGDIRSKSFHGTLSSDSTTQDASSQIDELTGATQQMSSGKAIFNNLTARAKHKEHVMSTLGADTTFRDYKSSMVGSTGKDSDLRRQLTIRQREERNAREERFRSTPGNATGSSQPLSHRRNTGRRQKFNAEGSTAPNTSTPQDRQSFNADPGTPRIAFREPPSRGYDPFR